MFEEQIALAEGAAPSAPVVPLPVSGRVLHVDGDYLAYWASGSDDTEPGIARMVACNKVEAMRMMTGSVSVVMHLTHSASNKGERYFIATQRDYQGQRVSGRKPKNWAFLRGFLENYEGDKFRVKQWLNREADDGMSLMAYWDAVFGEVPNVAHATRDKDMRMLPGVHINWVTQQLTYVPLGGYDVIGEDGDQYGTKWFWQQMLQGDTADHIPGLPKCTINGSQRLCGEGTAAKLLEGLDENAAANTVLTQYSLYFGHEWPEMFCEQAMLLWLRNDYKADVCNFITLRKQWPDVVTRAAYTIRERVINDRNQAESIAALQRAHEANR